MSFAGHALDTIARLRQNRADREVRKNRRAEIRDLYLDTTHTQQKKLKDKEIAPEELEKRKQNIRENIRREKRRTTILT